MSEILEIAFWNAFFNENFYTFLIKYKGLIAKTINTGLGNGLVPSCTKLIISSNTDQDLWCQILLSH